MGVAGGEEGSVVGGDIGLESGFFEFGLGGGGGGGLLGGEFEGEAFDVGSVELFFCV